MLIAALVNSIKYSNEKDDEKLFSMLNEDHLWKECCSLLKDFFDLEFLSNIKANKALVFNLYKLYLLHTLSSNMNQIEEA